MSSNQASWKHTLYHVCYFQGRKIESPLTEVMLNHKTCCRHQEKMQAKRNTRLQPVELAASVLHVLEASESQQVAQSLGPRRLSESLRLWCSWHRADDTACIIQRLSKSLCRSILIPPLCMDCYPEVLTGRRALMLSVMLVMLYFTGAAFWKNGWFHIFLIIWFSLIAR